MKNYEGKVTIRVTHVLARSEADAQKRIADIVARQGFFVDEVHAFAPMVERPPPDTGAQTPPDPSNQAELPGITKP